MVQNNNNSNKELNRVAPTQSCSRRVSQCMHEKDMEGRGRGDMYGMSMLQRHMREVVSSCPGIKSIQVKSCLSRVKSEQTNKQPWDR